MSNPTANKLSEDLLLNVKLEKDTKILQESINTLSLQDLQKDLASEENKLAFWINIYNAYYQILHYSKGLKNPEIYKAKEISIASELFSLDDIEHGILRRYRWKYSLGYLPQFWASSIIKKLAVKSVDYRIHFALNCGAASCPAIAFYNAQDINDQLENAADLFINEDTVIDDAKKEIKITKLFQWFKADFKGAKGIRSILEKYLSKDLSGYKLTFKTYDWSEKMKNFNDGSFS